MFEAVQEEAVLASQAKKLSYYSLSYSNEVLLAVVRAQGQELQRIQVPGGRRLGSERPALKLYLQLLAFLL